MRGVLTLAAVLLASYPVLARAQAAAVHVGAARRDTITSATTVTAAFVVSNAGRDTARVTPRIGAPRDWPVLMGTAPVAIPPGGSGMVIVSVVVPARTRAGIFAIRVDPGSPAGDSVLVRVPERRHLEITLLDRPAFVVSGKAYTSVFIVRNRGNSPLSVRLAARSASGRATLADTLVQLSPDESRPISATVVSVAGLSAAADDVLEITARYSGMDVPLQSSARVTVVPEPDRDIEKFLRIPAQVNLRAASSDAVSPFEIFGAGTLRDGGNTRADFLFRGPTGRYAAFGERDEYRVQVGAPGWRLRLGDQLYVASALTGGAQPGFGAGVEATRGMIKAGTYGQQFRRAPQKGTEAGAFLHLLPRDGVDVGVNVVNRAGGLLPGHVASATADVDVADFDAQLELARSTGASGAGFARSARVSRSAPAYSIDLGHQQADTAFSGIQRGAQHSYLSATAHGFEPLSFSLNGGRHRTDLSRSTGVPYIERLDVANFGTTAFGRYTAEAGWVDRNTVVAGVTRAARQQSIRLRGDQDLVFGLLSIESEFGIARDALLPSRSYSDVSLGVRRTLRAGSLSGWIERYSGGSITRGSEAAITMGGDGTMRIGRQTDLSLMGHATRLRGVPSSWHSQLDATISRLLPNGGRVSLRARLLSGGTLSAAQQSVAYLEYGMPLRVPVSRLRTPGRVHGRVIDAVTGTPVAGALVRLGPQVAITDRRGQVAFGGVPGGEHRLSMSQETSFADAVFIGDPTLRVDSARAQPTVFQLAIARGARLDVDVRRFVAARMGVAGAPDSLADAGPMGNATLTLTSARDTLYRTTGEDGRVSFADVPPGAWVVFVRGEAPAFHRFEPDRIEIRLAPGEARSLSFRLVPRRREVQLIGEQQELRNQAAEPKSQPAPAVPRPRKPDQSVPTTRKPDEQRSQDHTDAS